MASSVLSPKPEQNGTTIGTVDPTATGKSNAKLLSMFSVKQSGKVGSVAPNPPAILNTKVETVFPPKTGKNGNTPNAEAPNVPEMSKAASIFSLRPEISKVAPELSNARVAASAVPKNAEQGVNTINYVSPSAPEMPNAPILEIMGQRKRLHMPYRLKSLLEDMVKEVLLANPENIYVYLADYCDKRKAEESKNEPQEEEALDDLETLVKDDIISIFPAQKSITSWNDKGSQADTAVAAAVSANSRMLTVADLHAMLTQYDIDAKYTEKIVITIQRFWRGYLARKRVKNIRQNRLSMEDENQIPASFVVSVLSTFKPDLNPKDQSSVARMSTALASVAGIDIGDNIEPSLIEPEDEENLLEEEVSSEPVVEPEPEPEPVQSDQSVNDETGVTEDEAESPASNASV